MSFSIEKIVGLLESLAPLNLAEGWDNPGLQVGSYDYGVETILFSLDPSPEAIDKASLLGPTLLVTHHPLIFKPLKRLDTSKGAGRLVSMAIERGLTIYSLHTNLDSALKGLNYFLATRFGIGDLRPLEPQKEDPKVGMGRCGRIKPVSFDLLLKRVSEVLAMPFLRFVRPKVEAVEHIAVVAGSGGSYIERAYEEGSQVLFTGDVGYHHYLLAKDLGIGVVDITHHASEELAFRDFAYEVSNVLNDNGICVQIEYLYRNSPPFERKGFDNITTEI
ncbi:MAG: Nif3-like dinuclear metal center hexameric protein [Desulfatiglandales bacterium]